MCTDITCTFVVGGGMVEKRGVEESVGHVVRHVLRQQRILNPGNQTFPQDYMRGLQVPHANHGHRTVEVVDFRHVNRAPPAVLFQRRRFEVCSVFGHRPWLPYRTYVRESLFRAYSSHIQKSYKLKFIKKKEEAEIEADYISYIPAWWQGNRLSRRRCRRNWGCHRRLLW